MNANVVISFDYYLIFNHFIYYKFTINKNTFLFRLILNLYFTFRLQLIEDLIQIIFYLSEILM